MKAKTKIVVDAMGGDYAPQAVVDGAVLACSELPVSVTLVGNAPVIESLLKNQHSSGSQIAVQHASQVVEMGDNPLDVVRKKKDSSIRIGMDLVRDQQAAAFLSAGNSGAVVSGALFILKRLKGIERPAIATFLPTLTGSIMVADVGANSSSKPHHLVQIAIMSSVYCQHYQQVKHPRIGILSNGEEETKGTETIKQADSLLKQSSLNYIGYIEGKDIFHGNADIAVCDGFTGNILLKSAEAVAESVGTALKEELQKTWLTKIGYLLSRRAFKQLKKRFDYAEYGGAPLLGVNAPVIIAHGRSNAYAIKNAIRAAHYFTESNVIHHTLNDIETHKDIQRLGKKPSFINKMLHLNKPDEE